jgi:hypothetical protein
MNRLLAELRRLQVFLIRSESTVEPSSRRDRISTPRFVVVCVALFTAFLSIIGDTGAVIPDSEYGRMTLTYAGSKIACGYAKFQFEDGVYLQTQNWRPNTSSAGTTTMWVEQGGYDIIDYTALTAGDYTLTIHFNGYGSRPLDIGLSLDAMTTYGGWGDASTAQVTLTLAEGVNQIYFGGPTNSSAQGFADEDNNRLADGPDLDWGEIVYGNGSGCSAQDGQISTPEYHGVEFEDYTGGLLSSKPTLITCGALYLPPKNACHVPNYQAANNLSAGRSMDFNVNVTNAGTYLFRIYFMNGSLQQLPSGNLGDMTFTVNGASQKVTFPVAPSGALSYLDLTVKLKQGSNALTLKNATLLAPGPATDYGRFVRIGD